MIDIIDVTLLGSNKNIRILTMVNNLVLQSCRYNFSDILISYRGSSSKSQAGIAVEDTFGVLLVGLPSEDAYLMSKSICSDFSLDDGVIFSPLDGNNSFVSYGIFGVKGESYKLKLESTIKVNSAGDGFDLFVKVKKE